MADNQVQTDSDQSPASGQPAGTDETPNNGTNTAFDDWQTAVNAALTDTEDYQPQGEEPADDASEESQEEETADPGDQPEEEQEQISEQEQEVEQVEQPDPEPKGSMRVRLKDELDIAAAQLAKVKGISVAEAVRIIDAAQATPAAREESAGEQTAAAETSATVQARIEELEDLEAKASAELEFETANEHRKEANRLRNKLIDLKIAEVQEQSRAQAEAEREFYAAYEKSEAKALGLYPDAAKPDSPLQKEILRLEAEMLELGDPLYHSADKPFILAREAAKNLGIPMKKPGTAPVQKTVQHRPMQPVSGNARTTTTDPAKKASEAIEGLGSMRDYQDLVNSL